jgi:hypothetical protein
MMFALVGLARAASDPAQEQEIAELKRQISALSDQLERLESRSAASEPGDKSSATTIGGYGEASYNRYRRDKSRSQADLKRFVLFFGHRFNDQLSFDSEVEWEHAVTSADDQGESEIEQAYLTYQPREGLRVKTGLMLMPFGILNLSHEPPVFQGVERNEIETRIIPSTWREGGVAFSGNTDLGLAWDLGVTTGFDVAKFDDASTPLRASHQELQLAKAGDLGYFGALNYRGIPGFTVGGSLFTGNSFHGNADFKADASLPDFSGLHGRVTLWELHTRWQRSGLDLEALYAHGGIAQADKIDAVLRNFNASSPVARPFVPSAFYGWLVQGAYTVWQSGDKTLTPFARFEKFDTQSQLPLGLASDPINADRVMTAGVSFKLHPEMVFKADFQWFLDHRSEDRLNFGVGYMF